MNELPGIKQLRVLGKVGMEHVAAWLYKVGKGKITANFVTWFSVLMHIPAAILIARGDFVWAAVLMIIFGLFDSVDGALARLSGTAGTAGMVLDSFSDRLKETFVHTGVAYFLATSVHPTLAAIPVATLGFALATNFLKAKAEVAYSVIHDGSIDQHTLNKKFSDGALSFEVRTAIFILGVLLAQFIAKDYAVLAVTELVLMVGIWQTPKDMKAIFTAIHPAEK
jgi:phosphatidylglycerophosphate synthase